jgi:DHA1 family multidrug resistance protein-like MFS transporter
VVLTRQQLGLLLPLGTAVALSLTGDSTLYAVLPNQLEVAGITLGVVGILLGVNRLIRIPGNPLAGVLCDRVGRRRPFLLGLLLGIASTLSYSLVRGFWPLLAARLLWGVAWALINVSGYSMVLDWSRPDDRGRMAGFYQVAYLVGLSISPILGGTLTDALGFRLAVRACAAVSSIGLVVAFVALPETMPAENRPTFGTGQMRGMITGVAGVLRHMDRRLLLVGYLYFMVFFVSNGILMSTISLYLGQRWGSTIQLAGITIGVASLAGLLLALRASLGILAGPLGGALSDRLGDRWPVIRVAILVGAAGFLCLALVAELLAVPLGVGLVSISAGALVAVLVALVGDLATGQRQGATVGGMAAAGDIGSALGPLLAYALAVTTDLRLVYLFCAAALASGLVATVGQGSSR